MLGTAFNAAWLLTPLLAVLGIFFGYKAAKGAKRRAEQ